MTTAQDRLEALAEAAAALAGELTLEAVLQTIVDVAMRVTGARYGALGIIGEDETIARFIHHGLDEETAKAIGQLPRGKGLLGLLIRDPRIVRTDQISSHPASYGFPEHHPPMDSFIGAPVRSGGRVFGNLYLTEKPGGFDEHDERLVAVLAAQAGAAIENAELAERLQSLAVADERDRISRDLHDGVIQSLFSIGMGLESARALIRRDPDRADQRIDSAVDAIDGAIRELRNYIFQLRPHQAAAMGLTRGLAELAREHEVNALVRPELAIQAHVDRLLPPAALPDVLQIVREALSNAAKHAGASQVIIAARADASSVVLTVSDNGVGFATSQPHIGRGLDNIRERAEALAGKLDVTSTQGEGTTVSIQIPLGPDDARGDAGWSE
ncbi:MAG TPA: GAF domain-containing sensor histidine kinase [Egibacteraceae bacterium]|nr:GAF domain-containing sensor histidine kinase [Egibacteraceae bacterium]